MKNSDGFETIRRFLTPILLMVIGYLLSQKLKAIDEKVDDIVKIQITMASQAAAIGVLQRDQQELREDFRSHVNGSGEDVQLYDKAAGILEKTKKYKRK